MKQLPMNLNGKEDEEEGEKLITPKARRLFPSLNNNKTNFSSNKKQKISQSVINFDNITLEEINKDFLRYSQRIEDEKCEKELMNILCNSTKENSIDSQYRKQIIIERPENPFEKNLVHDENNKNNIDDCYYSNFFKDNMNMNIKLEKIK